MLEIGKSLEMKRNKASAIRDIASFSTCQPALRLAKDSPTACEKQGCNSREMKPFLE